MTAYGCPFPDNPLEPDAIASSSSRVTESTMVSRAIGHVLSSSVNGICEEDSPSRRAELRVDLIG